MLVAHRRSAGIAPKGNWQRDLQRRGSFVLLFLVAFLKNSVFCNPPSPSTKLSWQNLSRASGN